MKKIAFISNMAAPYQIENCKYLNQFTGNEYYFIFTLDLESNRPVYWKNLPFEEENTLVLKTPKFITKKIYYNPDVFEELNKLNPDVVIVGGYNNLTGFLAALWAKKNRKKRVLYVERFLNSGWLKSKIKKLIFRIVSRVYDVVFAIGNDAYKEYSKLANSEVFNIPYLLNVDRYNSKKMFNEGGSDIVFLYSGRFSENQPTTILLNAFVELCENYSDIRLILSGNGENLQDCLNIANNSNFSDKIIVDNSYTSWFEMPSLYAKADILVAPLKHSGWGFVVEEAMASGLGIITTYETSAGNENIIDQYNGYLISYSKDEKIFKDSIKNAMRKYIENRELISIHGRRNKEIKSSCDFKSNIDKFDKMISGV